jgi:methyl-accepting chemotaxis protein
LHVIREGYDRKRNAVTPLLPPGSVLPGIDLKPAEFLREGNTMSNLDNQNIQLALVAAVALAMLIQAIVLLFALLALRKLANSIRQEVEDLRSKIMPVIENTRVLIERVAPKIEQTTSDLAMLTRALRDQTADIQAAADEIIGRAQHQARRVDGMLSNVLDTVDRAGSFVADTVARPMRQLSAFLASAKAVIESLRSTQGASRADSNRASGDNDLFV